MPSWPQLGTTALALTVVALAGCPVSVPTPFFIEECTESAADMVCIEGGLIEETSVADPSKTRTRPVHAFLLDALEVSANDFEAFLSERCIGDMNPIRCRALSGVGFGAECTLRANAGPLNGNRPVNCVPYDLAAEYCARPGKRLPYRRELQHAAKGPAGGAYPWGETSPTCELAHTEDCVAIPQDVAGLPAGANAAGAFHLIGNVAEWTRTVAGEAQDQHLIFGGAISTPNADLLVPVGIADNETLPTVGFRCARDGVIDTELPPPEDS